MGEDREEERYSAVERCMPCIGYPHTLDAMDVTDEMPA